MIDMSGQGNPHLHARAFVSKKLQHHGERGVSLTLTFARSSPMLHPSLLPYLRQLMYSSLPTLVSRPLGCLRWIGNDESPPDCIACTTIADHVAATGGKSKIGIPFAHTFSDRHSSAVALRPDSDPTGGLHEV